MVNRLSDKEINESIRQAEGSIKHEGMYLTDKSRELIKSHLMGEISKKDFIKKVCEQADEEVKKNE